MNTELQAARALVESKFRALRAAQEELRTAEDALAAMAPIKKFEIAPNQEFGVVVSFVRISCDYISRDDTVKIEWVYRGMKATKAGKEHATASGSATQLVE